jgi:hypothetical protein
VNCPDNVAIINILTKKNDHPLTMIRN